MTHQDKTLERGEHALTQPMARLPARRIGHERSGEGRDGVELQAQASARHDQGV